MGIIKLSINTKLIFEGSNALPLSYPMKTRGYQVLKRMVLLSVGHSTLLIIGFLLLSTTSVFSQSKSRILLQLDSAYQAANEVEKGCCDYFHGAILCVVQFRQCALGSRTRTQARNRSQPWKTQTATAQRYGYYVLYRRRLEQSCWVLWAVFTNQRKVSRFHRLRRQL